MRQKNFPNAPRTRGLLAPHPQAPHALEVSLLKSLRVLASALRSAAQGRLASSLARAGLHPTGTEPWASNLAA